MSKQPHLFRDRADAGQQLGRIFLAHGTPHSLILGIPRGGVSVAAAAAQTLAAPLGVLAVSRLAAPYQPQLTLGAVAADGTAYVDEALAREVGATGKYLAGEQLRRHREARADATDLGAGVLPAVAGRRAIVVDEGLVTGAVMTAAVRALRNAGAEHVIVAVPAGPPKALARLRDEADEVVCLVETPRFLTVDQLYGAYPPVDLAQLRTLLAQRRDG